MLTGPLIRLTVCQGTIFPAFRAEAGEGVDTLNCTIEETELIKSALIVGHDADYRAYRMLAKALAPSVGTSHFSRAP